MAYRQRNQTRAYRIPVDELGMPVRVFIGKKGVVIKLLQELCQCSIRVNNKNNCVEVFAVNRKLVDAKQIIDSMVHSWKETGRVDLPKPRSKQQRPKVTIQTDSEGWTTHSSTVQKKQVEEKVQSPVATSYRGQFADLGESSDDETPEPDSPTEEFPTLSSTSKIQLTIREKKSTPSAAAKPRRRWADICDEESDDEE